MEIETDRNQVRFGRTDKDIDLILKPLVNKNMAHSKGNKDQISSTQF